MSETIIDVIQSWAERKPNNIAYTILNYTENTSPKNITYFDLFKDIQIIASNLQRLPSYPIKFALLCFAHNELYEFIKAFYGCLAAGVIAIPLYPPKKQHNVFIDTLLQDLQPELILTTEKTKQLFNVKSITGLHNQAVNIVTIEEFSEESSYQKNIADIAFLQYTSGSTSLPKGVMVSHKNIMSNQKMIKKCFGHDEYSDFVGWLPLHHDMGLIGNTIQPIYIGARSVLMSPTAFFQKPARWLQAISDFKAHTSGGPNFAYQMCIDELDVSSIETLDLSYWKVAFNGAEPIHASTLQKFQEKFLDYGFSEKSLYPCYGLAEATLFVTGAKKSEGPILTAFDKNSLKLGKIKVSEKNKNSITLASSGYITQHNNVQLLDSATKTVCSDLMIGEVLISGNNIAQGYWGLPDLSLKQFNVKLAQNSENNYYKTGDLGFIYEDNLYIVGRAKDLIIIRGKNYYPNDIEMVAKDTHEAFAHCQAAAFEIVQSEMSGFVVIIELNRNYKNCDLQELKEQVSQKITQVIGIKPSEIVIVRQHSLPVTTSGKIRRSLIKEQYLEHNLKIIGEAASPKIENTTIPDNAILNFLSNYDPRLQRLDLNKSLNDYGFDSLDTIKLINQLNKNFSVNIELDSLPQELNFSNLIQATTVEKTGKAHVVLPRQNKYPLTPNQVTLYIQQKMYPKSQHYVISETFCFEGKYSLQTLKEIAQKIMQRHPILNSNISFENNGYYLTWQAVPEFFLQIKSIIEGQLATELDNVKNELAELKENTLAKLNFFIINENKLYLNFSIHHVIFDLWSSVIIINDIKTLMSKESLMPSVGYSEYCCALTEQLENSKNNWKAIWENLLMPKLVFEQWPNKLLSGYIGPRTAAQAVFSLDVKEYDTLLKFSATLNAGLFDLLLAAYAFTLYKYSSQQCFVILSPFNGRTQTRYHDTVGYFVKTLPILIELDSNQIVSEFICSLHYSLAAYRTAQNYPATKIFNLINENPQARSLLPYQIMFTYQKLPFDNQEIYNDILLNKKENNLVDDSSALKITHVPHENFTTEVDLDMAIFHDKKELQGYIKYSTAQYNQSFIQQFIEHFKRVLLLFAQNADQSLKNIDILSKEEQEILLHEINRDNVKNIPYRSLYEIFSETVLNHPEQIAVQSEEGNITYAELTKQVNSLADLLMLDTADE